MKIVAIIPIKSRSERVKNKNFKKINGKPLYKFLLEKVKKCNFDEVYIDSDSSEIENYCKKNKLKFIKRLPKLTSNKANGNHLLCHHEKLVDADLYFQLFVTSPLIKVETINNCINILKKNKKYDSIFTVQEIYSWFWFNNKPVNYNPKTLPRSQDAKPIIQETTGLYGVRRKILKKRKSRIGLKPFFYKVSAEEVIDLDNLKDFDFLKYYVSKNNNRSKY
jgi:CMP-N-acetylneuraminic acid synthetase